MPVQDDADVIVVGAGPAGSAVACHAARAGLRVLALEKSTFPREKVCGDGLTPRGVRGVQRMGIDVSTETGWLLNKGLRVYGGGVKLEMPWPDLASWPAYGAVRTRMDLDEMLAGQAVKAGAQVLQGVTVTGPVRDDRTGRVVGVTAKPSREIEPDGAERTYRAPVVVAADGNSARLALGLGRDRRQDRPMGVAYRTYFTSPRSNDDHLESWLQLWGRHPESGERVLLPGYGWIFGLGDGTANVGLGMLNTTKAWQGTDYRALMKSWVAELPGDWEFSDETQLGPIRGAALPMGLNRVPTYADGVLLVGDSAGTVNPFNGEGIAYALESGEMAAEVLATALRRPAGASREKALAQYPIALKAQYGGYYTLGRWFVKLIGDPRVMKLATERGLHHDTLMKFVLKLLANLTEVRGGDAMDRVINGLARITPDA